MGVLLPISAYSQVLDVKLDDSREGPAVKIPVSDQLWQPAGTLAFRFKSSRTIRFIKGSAAKLTLLRSPVLEVVLHEDSKHPFLALTIPSSGDYKPKGRLDISHLKGGRWYHLALAWDAKQGRLDAYLNGVLQEQMRLVDATRPWSPIANPTGPLELGGTLGAGDTSAQIIIGSVQLYPAYLDETALMKIAATQGVGALEGEGRTVYAGPLDLSGCRLSPLYQADFTKPLNVIAEDELFEGDKRVHVPEGKEWVLEGPGRAWTQDGRLNLESQRGQPAPHVVLWNTRVFPGDFLLEFGMSPKNSRNGLNIVFFCAKSRDGGGVFDLGLPHRGGVFNNYHTGTLNCYHISYWACSEGDGGTPRRTTNMRKNYGFYLTTCGDDRIAGQGDAPHLVRLLKVGRKILIETRGQISLQFDDDGTTYGPVWGEGTIGLRQMAHTESASYSHFKVWKVDGR